jgi:hypothetical protein
MFGKNNKDPTSSTTLKLTNYSNFAVIILWPTSRLTRLLRIPSTIIATFDRGVVVYLSGQSHVPDAGARNMSDAPKSS